MAKLLEILLNVRTHNESREKLTEKLTDVLIVLVWEIFNFYGKKEKN